MNAQMIDAQTMETVDFIHAVFMNKSCPPGFHAVKLESVDHVLDAKLTKCAAKTVIAKNGENAVIVASVKGTLGCLGVDLVKDQRNAQVTVIVNAT